MRALVEGSTAYSLFAVDDFDAAKAHAKATYTNSLLLPLDGLGAHHTSDDSIPIEHFYVSCLRLVETVSGEDDGECSIITRTARVG